MAVVLQGTKEKTCMNKFSVLSENGLRLVLHKLCKRNIWKVTLFQEGLDFWLRQVIMTM